MSETKRDLLSFIHDWLEGISSTGGELPLWSPLEEEAHSEAIQALCRFAADGDEHRGIVAHNIAHVYRCLLLVFNVKPLDNADIVGWIQRWEGWSRSNDLTPILKWWFVAMFSFCTGQPLPVAPPAIHDWVGMTPTKSTVVMTVLPGRAGHFLCRVVQKLRKRLSVNPKHARSLSRALTLRFLAKGTAVVSEETVGAALEKHRRLLTEVVGSFPREAVERSHSQRLKDEIRRTVFEVFDGKTFTHRKRPMFPSRKGHVGTAGKTGGAASAILRTLDHVSECAPSGMVFDPRIGCAPIEPLTDSSQQAFASCLLDNVRRDLAKPGYRARFFSADHSRFQHAMRAKPMAVREPCKTRIVSLGPEDTYYYLKDIQKFMWSILKDHPCFQLIGQPVTEEVLMNRFGDQAPGSVFVSVDYSDATDGLKSWASEWTMRCVAECTGMSDFDLEVSTAALTGHTLLYTENGGFVARKQTNGQLMGSPVSFPILCLINAAVCRAAMESPLSRDWGDLVDEPLADYRPPLSLRKAPLLINGDDGLFVQDNAWVYSSWISDAKQLGLNDSPGKTYVSAEFVQINSKLFTVGSWTRPSLKTGLPVSSLVFSHVPYVNFGYLSPFDPKGGRERDYQDLPALAEGFLDGFSGKSRDAMMTWFLRSHRGLLARVPQGMSYWLPAHLGGLGLPITRKLSEDDFSDMQLNFAAFLLQTLKEPTTFPSEETTVPSWVRAGERLASSLRQREKGVRNDEPRWMTERVVPEDEQFLYWRQAGLATRDEESYLPASRGNWKRLFARFAREGPRGGNSRPPLATLLGDPSPKMVLPPSVSQFFELQGKHPVDYYGRISSLVEDRPYEPVDRELGRVVVADGVVFELFERSLCIRMNPFVLPSGSERHVGLRCLIRSSMLDQLTTDTNVCRLPLSGDA